LIICGTIYTSYRGESIHKEEAVREKLGAKDNSDLGKCEVRSWERAE
jgi:hypothetical protein